MRPRIQVFVIRDMSAVEQKSEPIHWRLDALADIKA